METRRSTDQMGNERYWTEVSIRPYHGSFAKLNSSGSGAESSFPETKPQNEPSQWRNYKSTENYQGSGTGGSRRGLSSDSDEDDNIPF